MNIKNATLSLINSYEFAKAYTPNIKTTLVRVNVNDLLKYQVGNCDWVVTFPTTASHLIIQKSSIRSTRHVD